MANDKKVFRVLISESRGFYVDTEAMSAQDAMQSVRARLRDNEVVPSEDITYYSGYQVDDAIEIRREDADLE